MEEKYYREALSNIRDYASNRRECSLYLEIVERMASDALQGKDLTTKSSGQDRHILKFCPDCDREWDECKCGSRESRSSSEQ